MIRLFFRVRRIADVIAAVTGRWITCETIMQTFCNRCNRTVAAAGRGDDHPDKLGTHRRVNYPWLSRPNLSYR
jgi:hypothetical protein